MRTRLHGWMLLLVLGALAGCALPGGAPGGGPGGPLLPSLQATTHGDSVQFVLQVTNVSEAPVRLEFTSGQTYDFAVQAGGREVWRWSADQMFTQALHARVVAPGETLTYAAAWRPGPGRTGEHTVVGSLVARNHPVRQAMYFRIP
jgi:hypothetical protein